MGEQKKNTLQSSFDVEELSKAGTYKNEKDLHYKKILI